MIPAVKKSALSMTVLLCCAAHAQVISKLQLTSPSQVGPSCAY